MRCKQTRREIALWVGGDHDPRLHPLVESHLADCPECRAFAREMKHALQPLRTVAARSSAPHSSDVALSAGTRSSGGMGWSLWPSVHARLARRRVQFNDLLDAPVGWVPVTGLTVACLALFTVVFVTSPISPRNQYASSFDAHLGDQTQVNFEVDRDLLLDNSIRRLEPMVSSVPFSSNLHPIAAEAPRNDDRRDRELFIPIRLQ